MQGIHLHIDAHLVETITGKDVFLVTEYNIQTH